MALGTTGINTTLVANTIGVGSNDVGTLCTSTNINKWSKWKPIRYNTLTGITLPQLTSTLYGLTIPSYTSLSLIIVAINAGVTWEYAKPQGGDSLEYYRSGDFRNYEHTATKPFSDFICPTIGFNNSPSSTIGATLIFTQDGGNYNIGLNDLIGIKDCYFAIYMIRTDGNTLSSRLLTAENTVGSGGADITISIHGMSISDYYVYPFLCNIKNTDPSIMPSGFTLYGLDGLTRSILTIKDTPLDITIEAAWHNDTHDSNQIDYTVTIYNNSGSSIDLQTCFTTLRFVDNTFSDPIVQGETQTPRGVLTIPANGQYSFSDNDTAYFNDSPNGFTLWFSSTAPYSIVTSTMVAEVIIE